MILTTPAQFETALLNQEEEMASRIPYSHFIDNDTIETKSGHLLQVIALNGLFSETLDDLVIDQEKQGIRYLLNSLASSSLSLYFHIIRKKIDPSLQANYQQPFAQQLYEKWQAQLAKQDFYVNEHYLTVVTKPPASKIRYLTDVIKSLSNRFNNEARKKYRQEAHGQLNKVSQQILAVLKQYGARKLSSYTCNKTNKSFSDVLAFLSYLLNLEERKVQLPLANVAGYLPYKRFFFDKQSATFAVRNNQLKDHYGAILAIKNYSGISHAGLFDGLFDVSAEMIITQTFTYLDKPIARNKINERQRNLVQSDDGLTSDKHKVDKTLDDLGTSEAAIGEHTFSILCHAASRESLEKVVTQVDAVLNDIGIVLIREDAGIKPAYFSILPGNNPYLIKKAVLSTKQMSGFSSFHNFYSGQWQDNHWGDAVTLLETISGTPFAFNFHVLDVGNTFLIGPMGSGKTLLEAFLLILSMKFGGRLIAFDKDRGLETAIRAMNGVYSIINAGYRTGMAPFQMQDTLENRYALAQLCKMIARTNHEHLSDEDKLRIKSMVKGAFQLPKEERIFRYIVPFLGMRKSGSLRMRFENWINDGDYAWVFDNEIDQFALNHPIIGLDMTTILDDPIARGPIYFNQFHCIEQLLDGTRTRIVLPEAWKVLHDEEFRKKIEDWSSTPRKKEALLVLDTQSPNDIAGSAIGCKIIQESVTQIYFANPTARHEEYVNKFGLTEKEFNIVKNIEKSSRYFLIKQGKNSVVARANLNALADEVIILSNRSKYKKILEAVLGEVGLNAEKWIPIYVQKIKEQNKR